MPPDFKTRTTKVVWSCLLTVALTLVEAVLLPPYAVSGTEATAQRETFDVVSIRSSQSGSTGRRGIRPEPSGLNATNSTALDLIKFAFDVIERDVVGELPSWVTITRFDVAAKTEKGPLTLRRVRAMARGLLEDRFGLNASSERANGRVYALVKVRRANETGPFFLRTSESTCTGETPLGAVEQGIPVRP